jgi:hypothetical protein
MRRFKLRIMINEPTISETPREILSGFNKTIESFNDESYFAS